ncbi:MAG TPA: hypothetical protein VGJ72_18765 [Polaromonas sp.]|jgi:hypothetical protein
MKRSPPSISAAQAKSIATYSKQQATFEAQAAKAEALDLDLERSLAQWEADLKKGSASIQKLKKWEKWFPRIAVFPISFLAMGLVFVVIYGLWTGDLPEISKYSKAHVFRGSNPVAFWFALTYHSAISGVFVYLAVKLLNATGWFRASKT